MEQLKILIVEDDINAIRRLRRHLNQMGHEITGTAKSTSEGLKLFHDNPPDLVIMDIELEDSNEGGILLAQSFTKIRNTPIIFYSDMLNESELRHKAAKIENIAILSKSFDMVDLQANIEKVVFQLEKDKQTLPIYQKDFFWVKEKNGDVRVINYKDVCYFESYDKGTLIVTDTTHIQYGMVLIQFEKTILSSHFQRIHKSYIVNIYKTRDRKGNSIYVQVGDDTEVLPFSNYYAKEFEQKVNFIKHERRSSKK